LEQALSQLEGTTTATDYTAAGMLGAIIFVISLSAQPLARRLAESEALAEQRGVDLANLAELNEYIVQHLRESIVVIDHTDHVRLMNASAAKHLGMGSDTASGRHLQEMAPELYAITTEWRRDAAEFQSNFSPFTAGDGATLITPHFAPLGQSKPAAALIFLEDATQLSERVQQAKLAALGRLSASIAHEIRNPVGAISHAGQLLAESSSIRPDEQRLTDIIHTQSKRVSTIIDNVLQLSRRDNTRPQQLVLAEWLDNFIKEFAAGSQLIGTKIPVVHDDDSIAVRFDPSHLHQVMWNLCENALRYASSPDNLPTLELHSGRLNTSGRPFLEVIDSGPGISEELADKIFEPFFTAAHDGTGLGLFIARELCECNYARLRYLRRQNGGSRFQLVFADPKRWAV
ncbi:MAG: PAS domain-containing protein, partial [Gammaproteobacteria bacterium]|nr:PAS domain-containing protein [Gammaproteobacteria bacterium]